MHNDIIQYASASAAKALQIAGDFAQALFPRTDVVFSDRMVSHARQYLRAVVGQLETRICLIATEELGVAHGTLLKIGKGGDSQSFAMLESSGLLKSDDIIHHVFLQTQQSELAARLLQKISQDDLEATLTRHLDHKDPVVAEAAMGLLVAQSQSNSASGELSANLSDLSAEIAYALAWPVAAALGRVADLPGPQLQQATERLLAAHDESAGVVRKAGRLARLLDQSGSSEAAVPHPMTDGLALFFARIARQSGLTSEQIVTFTAEPGMSRLVVTMRAADYPARDALSIFAALDSGEHILTAATYGEIDRDRAMALISRWSSPEPYQHAERILADDGLGDRLK